MATHMGGVIRRERTDAEKAELLKDPNLPLEVRNEFEQALGLPITPAPAEFRLTPKAVPVLGPDYVAPMPLPSFFDASGRVPWSAFAHIGQLPDGSTMLQVGADPIRPVRILSGRGFEMPLIPGACLMPGALVHIPLAQPVKMAGTGVLMRDGKVVRDGPVSNAQAEQDLLIEQDLRDRAHALIESMAKNILCTVDEMATEVCKLGYKRETAEFMIVSKLTP